MDDICIFEGEKKRKAKNNESNIHYEGQNTFNDLALLTSQSWPEAIVIAIQKAV